MHSNENMSIHGQRFCDGFCAKELFLVLKVSDIAVLCCGPSWAFVNVPGTAFSKSSIPTLHLSSDLIHSQVDNQLEMAAAAYCWKCVIVHIFPEKADAHPGLCWGPRYLNGNLREQQHSKEKATVPDTPDSLERDVCMVKRSLKLGWDVNVGTNLELLQKHSNEGFWPKEHS